MKNQFQTGTTYYLKFDTQKSFFLDTDVDHNEQFSLIFNGSNVRYRIDGGSWTSLQTGYYLQIAKNNNGIADIKQAQGFLTYDQHAFNTINTIEIYGTLTSMSTLDYNVLSVKYLQLCAIENPEVFNLYQLNCEDKVVGKGATGLLTAYDNVYGKFREETNVLTPSILFEYNIFPEFNYVYIPSLKRYYFVNNILLVRDNVYRVELKVDVLYTYETDIKLQNAFISRSGSAIAGRIDERLPLNKIPNIVTTKMTKYDLNRQFDSDQSDSTKYNIVVCVLQSHSLTYYAGKKQNLIDTDLPKVANLLGHSPSITAYAITMDDWKVLCDEILADNNRASYIVSVHMYPYSVSNDAFVSAGLKQIYLGTYGSGASGYLMQGYTSHYSLYAEHTFSKRFTGDEYDYLNYEPYTKYEMYISYHGWVPLDSKKVLGKTIHLYYIHNYLTGLSTAIIYNSTDKMILDSYQVNVGIALSISTTNYRQNEDQKDSNLLNMIMGMYAGGIQMATGIGSNKLGGVVGGAWTMAKAFMGQINSDMFIYDRGNTALNGELLGAYTLPDAYVRETYYQYDVSNVSYFRNTNGYKWDICADLSYALGYTEIPDLHYTPSSQKFITKSEIDEIVSLARSGIIL